jgi:queuine tRNA-ribosyltransferase
MKKASFEILAQDNNARAGRLSTAHGAIQTPSFVPVGTLGAVKALSSADLRKTGIQAIIANTYHLHLRPGEELIEKMGGLHRFMSWEGPLITDSGGFQVFSLGAAKEHGVGKIASIFPGGTDRNEHFLSKKDTSLINVEENGVDFISYLDGSKHRFTPERVIEIEKRLGADIILPLDECTSPLHDYDYTKEAMNRTHRWALRALNQFHEFPSPDQALMGIVQGGEYRDLREQSAAFIDKQDFDGYAIGGSLGKSKQDMHHILEWTLPFLSRDKPRHLLGIGEIEDVFEVVKRGIDLFDCVFPTKMAHTGTFLTSDAKRFRIHIMNSRFKNDSYPIEINCNCYTCNNYSRSYLRHLFLNKEPLAITLAAIHNLYFMESLMSRIRDAINKGQLPELENRWLTSKNP